MLVFVFVFLTGVILFGVVIYYLEQGQFAVTEAHPDGVYLRVTVDGRGLEVRQSDRQAYRQALRRVTD